MFARLILAAAAAVVMTVLATGCSIQHPIADDYGQYLANNKGARTLPPAKAPDQYFLPAATQAHRYEFRSATVGYAHVWVVEFGKVLDATMQSPDVVAALGPLKKAGDDKAAGGSTLVFDLQKYTFEDHGAHVELAISVRNAGGETFRKTYQASGGTQGAKMFFAGPFGMKNAVQQSTKLAMDDIFARFIADLNAAPAATAAR
jgi:hypothetical protein